MGSAYLWRLFDHHPSCAACWARCCAALTLLRTEALITLGAMRVLVIDDEPDIGEIVALAVRTRWPEADVLRAATGAQGLALAVAEHLDMVILDIGLPDLNGFEVLTRLRASTETPVLMLSARHEEIDKVRGLELGADDYVTKPFSHLELLARMQAVLRRAETMAPAGHEPPFVAGPLRIDYDRREVAMNGHAVRLTPIEYGILYHLTRHEGQVLTFHSLLTSVWGPEYVNDVDYVKVHIQHLRRKLGDNPADAPMIANERGVGYKFVRRDHARTDQLSGDHVSGDRVPGDGTLRG